MGLITQEVEVNVQGRNKSYYKKRGYIIPERIKSKGRLTTPVGTKITVSVVDLPQNSNVEVSCLCDKCLTTTTMNWSKYTKQMKEYNKCYCTSCSREKGWIRNSMTFEEWCYKNKCVDILKRWNKELNKCLPNEISYSSAKRMWFDCPKGIHEPESISLTSFTSNYKEYSVLKCTACNSFAQWGIDNICEDFLEKYWDYDKNKNINPWSIGTKSNKKIWIKCQYKDYHGSYLIYCYNFTSGNRCSLCSGKGNKVHPLDSLGNLLEEKSILNIWSDKNRKSPYNYAIKSNQYVWWKCLDNDKHNDYKRSIGNAHRFDFRCPDCVREMSESFLQEKVRLYLNKMRYKPLHEFNCTLKCVNPKTQYVLPYDNEININNNKLIIEVHGKQHYILGSFHTLSAEYNNTTPDEQLEYQQWKDKYKKDYALSQGYFYLEIPYWTDDENETWKNLIDDKIKEIKNQKEVV